MLVITQPKQEKEYHIILNVALDSFAKKETSYPDIVQTVKDSLGDNFEGSSWMAYIETVRLDLEATEMIERIQTKPQIYRIIRKRLSSISSIIQIRRI